MSNLTIGFRCKKEDEPKFREILQLGRGKWHEFVSWCIKLHADEFISFHTSHADRAQNKAPEIEINSK